MRRLLLLAALLLAGCGVLTNEDLRFLAVLPDVSLQADAPVEEGQALVEGDLTGRKAWRIAEAEETGRKLNKFVKEVVGGLDVLRTVRPSERSENRRVWGPFAMKGKQLGQLVIERDATVRCPGELEPVDASVPRFRFVFSASAGKDQPFEILFEGMSRGEDFDTSCGSFTFDVEANGKIGNHHDADDPRQLVVGWVRGPDFREVSVETEPALVEGEKVGVVRAAFRRPREGGSRSVRFTEFRNIHDRLRPRSERLETTLQWRGKGDVGRADVVVSEGDLVAPSRTITVCWSARLEGFYDNELDTRGTIGTRDACLFDDP